MLSNIQLLEIAIDFGIKLPMKNILMKNELNVPKVSNYVVNLQSNTEGNWTHWAHSINNRTRQCILLEDSFGALPSLEIIQFGRKWHGKYQRK